MKKVILLIATVLMAISASAQYADYADKKSSSKTEEARFRGKYRNFSFVSQSLTYNDLAVAQDRGLGAAFTTGRSYSLHRKPIAGMLRFAIDATWADLNYVHYNHNGMTPAEGDKKLQIHDASFAVGVGPSIHVNPVSNLWVNCYFRYAPTFSAVIDRVPDESAVQLGYATYFVAGGAVSWNIISLGAEARWGGGKLRNFSHDSEDPGVFSKHNKFKTSGVRAYISLRF